ncbi:MAG: RNA polymerase II mediator complex subunit [Bogoriella megaspora]|nr:MAG: RNA polymerase II mediator complex subunit [Bogoriella megaspora]
MAPDEISFASEEAWNGIHAWGIGHKRAIHDLALFLFPEGHADKLLTTSDAKFHARVRGLMSSSFTEQSLRAQSTLIEGHVGVLVDQFPTSANAEDDSANGALTDLADWFNFFTVNMIGDLALGESSRCPAKGEHHDQVRTVYDCLKPTTIVAAPRYWPILQFLLEKVVPKSVIEGRRRFQKYAHDRANQRLDSRSQRPDFVTPSMKHNPN